MPENRFFVSTSFKANQTLVLPEEEARHLKVMRLKEGETFELINGKGELAIASIKNVQKNSIEALIHEVKIEKENQFKIIIAQAIPRFTRLDVILEKGTELGMTELWLFPGEYSEKIDFSSTQKERIEKIIIAAIKQCGRLYLPKISFTDRLSAIKKLPFSAFYGDILDAAPSFKEAWQTKSPERGAIFFIGPEKGFSNNEISYLKNLEAIGVKLHPNILRTDTAPLAALSLMSHFLL